MGLVTGTPRRRTTSTGSEVDRAVDRPRHVARSARSAGTVSSTGTSLSREVQIPQRLPRSDERRPTSPPTARQAARARCSRRFGRTRRCGARLGAFARVGPGAPADRSFVGSARVASSCAGGHQGVLAGGQVVRCVGSSFHGRGVHQRGVTGTVRRPSAGSDPARSASETTAWVAAAADFGLGVGGGGRGLPVAEVDGPGVDDLVVLDHAACARGRRRWGRRGPARPGPGRRPGPVRRRGRWRR